MEIYPVKTASVLPLGKQGENLARQIQFDLSRWVSSFGPGTVQLLHQRSGDEAPYPVAVEQEGNLAIWTVTSGDTASAGTGRAELQYYVGDALAKSETWRTRVLAALGPAGETPPEAQQGWVDQVLQAGTEAAKAAAAAVHQPMVGSNGNWWTWDLEAGAYGDTGVPAEGPPGTVELETAVSDRKITWQFTEGMPEDKGLTYTGTEGKAVMQSDGLLVSPGASYQPPVLASGKAEMECVFSSPNFGTYYGFRLQLTNGTTGIRISCYSDALIYNQHTANNLTLAKLTTDTEYTLRIVWDEESGADVYLNGEAVLTGGKTSYALAENLVSQVSGGGTTLLKSLAYTFPGMGDEIVSIDGKGLRDETARAMAAQGGGAGGLTVTNTAAVGQTVRIAAVDETGQPTGWEAVDMASGGSGETSGGDDWTFAKEITLEEDAASIYFDLETPAKEMLVKCIPVSDDTNKSVTFFKDANAGYGSNMVTFSSIMGASTSGNRFAVVLRHHPEFVSGTAFYNLYNAAVGNNVKQSASELKMKSDSWWGDAFTCFHMGCWSGGTAGLFQAGTKVEVWTR